MTEPVCLLPLDQRKATVWLSDCPRIPVLMHAFMCVLDQFIQRGIESFRSIGLSINIGFPQYMMLILPDGSCGGKHAAALSLIGCSNAHAVAVLDKDQLLAHPGSNFG